MDYEKKYKEAMEAMVQWVAPCHTKKQLDVLKKSVFPELAESEDERIRKGLIKLLTVASEAYLVESTGINKDAFLAWLEKQKESTWTEEDESFRKHILPRILNPRGWTMEQTEADRERLKEFVERQKNKWVEKQKEPEPYEPKNWPADKDTLTQEQKPADDNPLDDPRFTDGFAAGRAVQKIFDEPAEWSEEDEKMLLSIINAFRNGTVSTIGQEQWLKSLPERFSEDCINFNMHEEKETKESKKTI